MSDPNNPWNNPPPNPGQAPWPPQQQQQQQQQAYPQQQQPAPYPPVPQHPGHAPPPAYPPYGGAPVPAAGPPTYHRVDDAAMQAQMEQAREDALRRNSGGGGGQFLKFYGPNGETKWSGVPIGYTDTKILHICPPWKQHGLPMLERHTHFYKSQAAPQGASLSCPDPAACLLCQAAEAGLHHPDPSIQKRAKDWGRRKKSILYNVIDLQAGVQAHIGEDGIPRPFILDAGVTLRDDLNEVFGTHGVSLTYPDSARPIQVKKTKTGPNTYDIEYRAMALDPQILPQEYWQLLNNLHDLDAFVTAPSHDDQVAAVTATGLPFPGAPPAAYNPYPQPPAPSPYPQAAPQGYPSPGYQPPPPPIPAVGEYGQPITPPSGYQPPPAPFQAPPPPPPAQYQPPAGPPPPPGGPTPPPMPVPQAPQGTYQPVAGPPPPPPSGPSAPPPTGAPPPPRTPVPQQGGQPSPDAELEALQRQLAGG